MDRSVNRSSEGVVQDARPSESQLRDRSGIAQCSGASSEAFDGKASDSKAEEKNGGKDNSLPSTAGVQNACNRFWIDLNEMPVEVDAEEDLQRLVNDSSTGANSQNNDRRDSGDKVAPRQIKMAYSENSSGLESGVPSAQVDEPSRRAVLPLKRKASEPDEKIVWPPVVIIENTRISYDGKTKSFKGLENEEIRKFLKAMKDCEFGRVLALYGPRGHRGKALVTFPPSYLGFLDAQALSECLQRANKGREEWLRVSRYLKPFTMDGWYTKDLVTSDGKRILYGYLARESDMLEVDPHKKNVKRWSMESYADKVLEPMKRIEQGKEEARKKREELAKEAKHKTLVVEQNKSELDKATEELKRINKESHLRKRHEEEVEALHRRNFETRKKAYDEERRKKMLEFQQRETEIRTHVEQSKIQQEKEMTKYIHAAQQLKDGIDEEKRKHEVRQKQIETMEKMDLHSDLQVMMEDRLAELEKCSNDKKLKLQEEHNCQIMKHKKEIAAKKEELLESKLKELQAIENEVKSAKDATEQMHKEVQEVMPVNYQSECIICFDEFGVEQKARAFYKECSHANVCISCATELWKAQKKQQQKPLCPTCKAVQTKIFKSLPAKFFF